VHAWSTIFTYRLEAAARGQGVVDWLERSFHGLLLNFTWWVNRKDRADKNVFEGGFLGLDNIGVFDRSAPLPTGGYLEQADGTAWMALFCQNMLEIAVELTMHRATYLRMCLKFVEHFLWISSSMFADDEGRDVGRAGRLLLRRAAAAESLRTTPQGSFDGRPVAAVRGDGLSRPAARAVSGSSRAHPRLHGRASRADTEDPRSDATRLRRPADGRSPR